MSEARRTPRMFIRSDLNAFLAFQIVIASICILIPLFLRWSDKDVFYPNKPQAAKIAELGTEDCGYDPNTTSKICKDKLGFRTSLSDYVYSSNSYYFGMLYSMAAMLFVFNGAVFFKSQKQLNASKNGKWYNVLLGVSLLCVIINPPHESPFWHNLFKILFFVGNIVVIGFFHHKKYRILSIILALITIGALIMALVGPRLISLLVAEWISLAAIGTHLILEAMASRSHRNPKPYEKHELDRTGQETLTAIHQHHI
jgi:hypothetical protein